MGAYLSGPKTDKDSSDEANQYLVVGASSMQGWRNSQEDAHNAILSFDANTSFFAVYDGHGGAEVAAYCADKLPQFLKELEAYKSGQFSKALQDAFLEFDKTLLEPEVIAVLKVLAGERNYVDPDDSEAMEDEDEYDDLLELHEESNLPLHEVLDRYRGNASMPILKQVREAVAGENPQWFCMRGRRAAAVAADAVNKAVMDPDAHPAGSSTSAAAAAAAAAALAASNDAGPSSSKATTSKREGDAPEEDSTVSSSSSSASKSNNNNNAVASVESTEAEAVTLKAQISTPNGTIAAVASSISPDSSHVKESEQNGNVTSSEAKTNSTEPSTSNDTCAKSTSEDAVVSGSSDSTANKQNGAVASSSVKSAITIMISASDRMAISSTSKEDKKTAQPATAADDSTDDETPPNAYVDFVNSSSEDDEDDDDEDADGDGDADDDDDDDDGDDEEDEEEDDDYEEEEESAMIRDRICTNMEEPGKDSGCTAVVALLNGRDLYVANAGDSRCVVSRSGKAVDMSLDHKPEDEEEAQRIMKAGGRVTLDGRVNGGLNLSRALGDHTYKMNLDLPAEEQMISAYPDVKKLIISPEDEFMVLACDGIWNFMSSDEVVEFVRVRLADETKKVSQICEELFDNCLAPNTMGDGTGCDNMTAVIVRFLPKLLELPTKLNVAETEEYLQDAKTVAAKVDGMVVADTDADADAVASSQKTLKRCASPTSELKTNEAENASNTKRLKTDDELEEVSSNNSHNAGNASKDSASSTTATSTANSAADDAVSKECDSGTSATNEAAAAALGST